MEFFTTLENILQISDPKRKIANFSQFYEKYQKEELICDHAQESVVFEKPSYASFCQIVSPKDVPKRKRLDTKEGRAILLHAIAHIEYSAIDLAIDSAYRYKNMPKSFYDDWLEVAMDECRHFTMIERLLERIGYAYGSFPVHQGLFDAGRRARGFLERMAVVPRYLEANGLDANPLIMEKLAKFQDDFAKEVVKALGIILDEEIGHVKKGNRWFLWECACKGIRESTKAYFEAVERIYPGTLHSKVHINVQGRREAGFSCEEIELLSRRKVDCR